MKNISRRLFAISAISVGLGLTACGGSETSAATQSSPDLVVINMADTHSAHDAYPKILQGIKNTKEKYKDSEFVFIFNGDLFELGDAVAKNSSGEIDWEFFKRLTSFGQVIINNGNHEFDFSSPEQFVERAKNLGITVIGTVNTATNSNLTPIQKDISVKGKKVRVVGIGTNQINTYPAALRPSLVIPDPLQWFKSNLAQITAGVDSVIVASHGGLSADVSMLKEITKNTNFAYWVGGHDHLVLRQKFNGVDFMHNGFKGERFNITEIYFSNNTVKTEFSDVITADIQGQDSAMAAKVEEVNKKYLTTADLAIIGTVPKDLSLNEAALWSTDVLKKFSNASVAFMPHSTIGAGVKAGPLSKYRFDLFMRFDNDVMEATVDAPTLRTMLKNSNQHEFTDLNLRTGDFLYTRPIAVEDGKSYKIVTTGWAAQAANVQRYFGTTNVQFQKVPNAAVKSILTQALN